MKTTKEIKRYPTCGFITWIINTDGSMYKERCICKEKGYI